MHVPFCRSMCWYCGCHTTVARQDGPFRDYVSLLGREIDLVAAASPRLRNGHLHFGGGSPTTMPPADLLELMTRLHRAFDFEERAEIAIEIDPRTLTADMAAALFDGYLGQGGRRHACAV
jgi:oxygen-independent coproporphyrinogen III oxidase